MSNKLESIGSQTFKRLRASFRTGKTHSLEWRTQQLNQIKKMLLDNRKEWEQAVYTDLHQDLYLRQLEVDSSIKEVDYMLKNLKTLTQPEEQEVNSVALFPASAQIYKDPYGVVLIIAPWNYPISLLLRPLAGAIAAGNVAVIKPSEVSTNVSKLFGKLVPKYFDEGVVECIEGGVDVTTDLLKQPWDLIFYTGSTMVGKIIMEAAAKHLTPVVLELGGKSPIIIDKDVDIDLAVRRSVWGKFINCGQSCIAPDYFFIHKDREQEFLDKVKKQITQFYGEDPQKSPDYGRVISDRHVKRLQSILESHEKDIYWGGKVDVKDRYISPTIIRNVKPDSAVMEQEIFGPIIPVMTWDNLDDVIDFINSRPKPLALYIFSNNKKIQEKVLLHTTSGTALVNDTMLQYVCETLPFGGVGESGIGNYHGKKTFECFTHRKSVLKKSKYMDVSIRYPPYTSSKVSLLQTAEKIHLPFKKIYTFLVLTMLAGAAYFIARTNRLL